MSENIVKDLSASLEDYLEVIYQLSEGESGERVARSKDIADRLDVAKSSVTGALRQLSDKGLINYKPYEFITLTEAGRGAAMGVVRKHKILKSFFVDILGVDSDVADNAACCAEHALGYKVIDRLLGFTDFVKSRKEQGHDISGEFENFIGSRN